MNGTKYLINLDNIEKKVLKIDGQIKKEIKKIINLQKINNYLKKLLNLKILILFLT